MKNRLWKLLCSDLRNYSGKRCINDYSFLVKIRTLVTNRGLWLISFHRAQLAIGPIYSDKKGLGAIVVRFILTLLEFFIEIFTKSHIRNKTSFGLKVYLSNDGNMIIGAQKIGSCSVLQKNITIGQNIITNDENSMPVIGKNVWIGSNCIIYGNVTIGDGVTICENTVLSRSIPENCVVKGYPAKVLMRNFDNTVLRMSPKLSSSTYIVEKKDSNS